MAGLRDYSGNTNTGTLVGTILTAGPLPLPSFVARALPYTAPLSLLGPLIETDVAQDIRPVTILKLSTTREVDTPQPMGLSATLNPYFVIKRGARSVHRGSFRGTH
jgi:hypothetical protein